MDTQIVEVQAAEVVEQVLELSLAELAQVGGGGSVDAFL